MEQFYYVDGDIFTRLELLKEYGNCFYASHAITIEQMAVGQIFSFKDPTGEIIIVECVKKPNYV